MIIYVLYDKAMYSEISFFLHLYLDYENNHL